MHSRLFCRLVTPVVGLIAAFTPLAQAAGQNRINTITESSRVALPHNVPSRVSLSTDLGPAPPTRSLSSLTLRFNMTTAQQADLSQLLVDQQNPSSPHYHQWLTPEQFGARFGLSSSDLAKVSTWLTSKGFTVTGTARSSTFITFSGTVAQAQQAFGTSIHSMSLNGEQHIANVTDPVLPSAIANVVTTINGLHDFKVKSRARVHTVQADAVQPRFTSSISGDHYIAPGDFYTIYDVNPLLTSGTTGTGITIAVMGQTDISLSDVAAFRSASGLVPPTFPTNPPTLKLYGTDPGISTNDLEEAQLDVEWSGAVAPGATILYVYSTDVFNGSLLNAVDNKLAPIISISYGECEPFAISDSIFYSFNQTFQQANAQGQTIVGPAGDSGATDCDVSPPATEGLAVDFPASSAYVTGAGGTMFNEGDSLGGTNYWNATNGPTGGSALSYIPETVWNETSTTNGLGAGGGGASAFFTKPAWQVGSGVPSDASRDVPDIALNAASIHDGYLFCSSGSCVNGFRDASNDLNEVGGTSVAAPSFAGILALVEQKLGGTPGLGNANPTIYALANSTYYNNVFHDITTGNNSSPCQAGTPNCPTGGSIGFAAGTGYDQATGWGSVDTTNLATYWNQVTPEGGGGTIGTTVSTTTLSTTAATCGISSGSLAINISVTRASGSGATPTGTIQFYVDGTAAGAAVTLSNGAATYTLNTANLSSGGHNVSAVYSGDTTYAGSKGTFLNSDGSISPIDVVSSSSADFALTPCTATASAVSGGTAPGITFTLTPFNGFTGPITLTATADIVGSLTGTFTTTPVSITSTTAGTTIFTLNAFQTELKKGTAAQLKANSSASNHPPVGKMPWYAAGSGGAVACILFLTLPRRRRWGALLAVVLSVAAVGAIGCGSSSSSTGGGGGGTTPVTDAEPGTYTLNVTATSGNLVHSAFVTFTVQ